MYPSSEDYFFTNWNACGGISVAADAILDVRWRAAHDTRTPRT